MCCVGMPGMTARNFKCNELNGSNLVCRDAWYESAVQEFLFTARNFKCNGLNQFGCAGMPGMTVMNFKCNELIEFKSGVQVCLV